MEKSGTSVWRIELREICKILVDNGVDIQKIPTTKKSSNGKRIHTTLKDINIEGIDINRIIRDNGLNGEFLIGKYLNKYRLAYNGTAGNLTQDEREEGERLGIVVKRNEQASKPIFKGRKLSQFHLDFINGILDKILRGELTTIEVLQLLKQAAIENNEAIIEDAGSIKRCVEIILKDRPEELNKYYETLTKNRNRHPHKGNIGKPKIGFYHEREDEFKKYIIEHYLPLIIRGEITLNIITHKLSTTNATIDKIIEEFYSRNNDIDGLTRYRKARKENSKRGMTIEKKEEAQRKREEVAKDKAVTKVEFVFLAPERQEEELIKKIRIEKLKEELSETSKRTSALISEEVAREKINIMINYFKSKNASDYGDFYFSDEDIRFMIFRYPTLINRTPEILDEKLKVLTSYQEIDERTAFGMIKEFPALMGYDASRTKRQLDLLKEYHLVDAVISRPRIFMYSVDLMYALIQFSKERYHTSDFSDIDGNRIFKQNSALKQLYGVSYDEIKAKYPYIIEEQQDVKFNASPDEIAKATYRSRDKSKEAEDVLKQALQTKEKGTQEWQKFIVKPLQRLMKY